MSSLWWHWPSWLKRGITRCFKNVGGMVSHSITGLLAGSYVYWKGRRIGLSLLILHIGGLLWKNNYMKLIILILFVCLFFVSFCSAESCTQVNNTQGLFVLKTVKSSMSIEVSLLSSAVRKLSVSAPKGLSFSVCWVLIVMDQIF